MKRIVTVIAVVSLTMSLGSVFAGNGYTEADIKRCIADKKQDAADRGYPILDPFAERGLRAECIKELKGEK